MSARKIIQADASFPGASRSTYRVWAVSAGPRRSDKASTRIRRIWRPWGKVSTSPTTTPCPGLAQRWAFIRKWPASMQSCASSRLLKKRAAKSHLSSRSFGWTSGLCLPEGPANQSLPLSAMRAAKGLSGSIGFSGRGGRASNDFLWSSRGGLPPLRSPSNLPGRRSP